MHEDYTLSKVYVLAVFANYFVVIKVVLYSFDDLIILVSFACYEDNISRFGERTSRLNSRFAVFDDECLLEFFFRQTCFHIIEDVCGFLIARVVGSENQLV